MALDATVGGSAADSMITLAEFKAYADSIGFVYASVYTDDVIEQSVRKGTQYMVRGYRTRWKGFRTDYSQTMPWPRTGDSNNGPSNYLTPSYTVGVIDADGYEIASNVIPAQVKEAGYELTILSLQGVDLLPRLQRGGAIESKRVKAGPVETETTYATSAAVRDRFLDVEGLLDGLVNSHPGGGLVSGRIVRS